MRNLPLFLAALVISLPAVLAGCSGDDTGDSNPLGPVEGLPKGFPESFPLYEGMEIGGSSPLGRRYIIDALVEADPVDVVAFYEEELAKDPWEIVEDAGTAQADATTLLFTAPDFVEPGRVVVKDEPEEDGRTAVAIIMPFDGLDLGTPGAD